MWLSSHDSAFCDFVLFKISEILFLLFILGNTFHGFYFSDRRKREKNAKKNSLLKVFIWQFIPTHDNLPFFEGKWRPSWILPTMEKYTFLTLTQYHIITMHIWSFNYTVQSTIPCRKWYYVRMAGYSLIKFSKH